MLFRFARNVACSALCLAVTSAEGTNPDTECATIAYWTGWEPAACVPNGCGESCWQQEVESEESEGAVVTFCQCGEGPESPCCNLYIVSYDHVPSAFVAEGSCDPNCGSGGDCSIRLGDTSNTFVANCQL